MRVFSRALIGALVLFGLFATSAAAGGWAISVLDPLPGQVHAGETYRIGYTILQHGATPFPTQDSAIVATSPTGEHLRFPGVGDGAVGHYAAQVRFPTAGTWTWEVDQTPFAVQSIGTVVVAPPAVEASTRQQGLLRLALPLGAFGAAALFVLRLWSVIGRVRGTATSTEAVRAAAR